LYRQFHRLGHWRVFCKRLETVSGSTGLIPVQATALRRNKLLDYCAPKITTQIDFSSHILKNESSSRIENAGTDLIRRKSSQTLNPAH
jgi:hypothetical protein